MPIKNLNLLLRPTPGGRNFISSQADRYLKLNLFSDLILLAPDGTASCHQSLIVPLSPLLQTLLSSYSGIVHTIITPLSIHTVNSILDIVYTGTVSFTNRLDMNLVMAGLQLLGIHLPGLDSFEAAGTPLDCTMPRGRTVEGNNNDIPRPFSTPQLPQASNSLQSSIVRLPSTKPMACILPAPQPILSLTELQIQLGSQLLTLAPGESVQCNVVGCRSQVSLEGLSEHFKSHQFGCHAFKCDECSLGFKDKKALEIHRIKNHMMNPEVLEEAIRNDKPLLTNVIIEHNFDSENVDEANVISTSKRKRRKDDSYVDDNKASENESEDDPDFSIQESEPVVKEPVLCGLCQSALPSEWHRHPRRHACPHATPKTTPTNLPNVEPSHCSLCDTLVPSSWHKPPSRHSCTAITPATVSPADVSEMLSTEGLWLWLSTEGSGSSKRARTESSTDVSVINTTSSLESSADRFDLPADHSCPLTNCSRQCTNKRFLLVHLAMVHYKEELETLIVTECGINKCSECDVVLPNNKMRNIMHMALDHEIVTKFAKRDKTLELCLDQALYSVINVDMPGEDEVHVQSKMGD